MTPAQALRVVVERLGGEWIGQDDAMAAHDAAATALGLDPKGMPTPRQRLLAGEVPPDAEQTLRREGWRPRLVWVEAELAALCEQLQGLYPEGTPMREQPTTRAMCAREAVAALIDGDPNPADGLVRLTPEEFAEIETNFNSVMGEGYPVDLDLLDRLRREVGA